MHGDHVRRGALAGFKLTDQADAERADAAAALAGVGQGLRDHLHAGGLAIGAGHADQAHAFAGAAVETVCDVAEAAAQVIDHDDRHIELRDVR